MKTKSMQLLLDLKIKVNVKEFLINVQMNLQQLPELLLKLLWKDLWKLKIIIIRVNLIISPNLCNILFLVLYTLYH